MTARVAIKKIETCESCPFNSSVRYIGRCDKLGGRIIYAYKNSEPFPAFCPLTKWSFFVSIFDGE